MQTKKTRIRWIDNARGICVFCVLLAHCKLEHTYLQMIYTPFFLALFFFLSGYLFNCHKDIKTDILKLVRNLIIPLKSATKLFSVLLASKRPLITELADKLRLKYPLLPTISPCPTMRLEAIRSIIPISCRRYPKSV